MSNKDYFGENVMSNDKDKARLFNLMAKISMMVVDGTRDATSVADVLQGVLNQSQQKSTSDPAAFIGEGWSFAEARNPRSAALGSSRPSRRLQQGQAHQGLAGRQVECRR